MSTFCKSSLGSLTGFSFYFFLGLMFAATAETGKFEHLDRTELLDATNKYLTKREKGAFEEVWEFLSQDFQTRITYVDFVKSQNDLAEKIGRLIEFKILRTSFDRKSKLYIVDYSAFYSRGFLECGYFVWKFDTDLKIQRIQRGQITAEQARLKPKNSLAKVLKCNVL